MDDKEFDRMMKELSEKIRRDTWRTQMYGRDYGWIRPMPVQPLKDTRLPDNTPVKPFDTSAEADQFHADVDAFLREGREKHDDR